MFSYPPIVLLVATVPERDELLERALLSVYAQHILPDAAVIVCDGGDAQTSYCFPALADSPIPTHCLRNQEVAGAANTWNTGIRYIAKHWPACYVAILDDDDEWDAAHLSTCLATALRHHHPDVVLSGLRLVRDGIEETRRPIQQASVQDFLAGNPGWQGSNTFIRLATLQRAGRFTPGLKSCNDRDLAIRVLSLEDVRVAYTGRHTASWHLDTNRSVLTAHGGQLKLDGLAHFYHLHGHRMSCAIRRQFFERASELFGWQQEDIMQRAKEWQHAYSRSPYF